MSMAALIRFFKDAEIIPNYMNIEHCEEMLLKMLPPQNSKEHEFY